MLMNLTEYQQCLRGRWLHYAFTGCTVRTRNIFGFVTEAVLTEKQFQKEEEKGWDPLLRPKALLVFVRNMEERWYGSYYYDGVKPLLVGATRKPLGHVIAVAATPPADSLDIRNFVMGSGPYYEDKPLPLCQSGGFVRGAVRRLKMIDGWLYACGHGRALGKRLDKGSWQSLTVGGGLPGSGSGFEDFDGFSEQDIYAAGGEGDVWHFDGTDWTQIPFPSQMAVSAVCCGGGRTGIYLRRQGGDLGRARRAVGKARRPAADIPVRRNGLVRGQTPGGEPRRDLDGRKRSGGSGGCPGGREEMRRTPVRGRGRAAHRGRAGSRLPGGREMDPHRADSRPVQTARAVGARARARRPGRLVLTDGYGR